MQWTIIMYNKATTDDFKGEYILKWVLESDDDKYDVQWTTVHD